jgi:hypothetical protein
MRPGPGLRPKLALARLPAPAAPFRPIMRLYQPEPAVLDGTYKVPPITKLAT